MIDIITKYSKYVILISLMYMPIFGFLDTIPIRIWDEARQAINAYEMYENGDFIVTHFGGEPDMWNTKPPLLIWIQVAFMHIFGINDLAIRLPSAIAAFFTCLSLMVLSIKYLKTFWFGFISILVLITSHGYINVHASRTGDYDALLTLFTTLSCLAFFAFSESNKNKYLHLFFIFTALAVLTKSVAGLMFLPAILIFSIIQKQFIPLLKNRNFYIGLIYSLIFVIGYYLLREINNNGYISAVQKNELGGRYLDVIENHKQGFWFYYNNFINFQLSGWYLLIPCGLITGLLIKDKRINRMTLFLFIIVATFFLIISLAQTKLEWYDLPLYPFLAILATIFIYYVFQLLHNLKWVTHNLAKNIIPFIFLFLICFIPYKKIIEKTYKPKEYDWDKEFYEMGYYLKDGIKGKYNLNNHYFLYDGYNAHYLFYIKILNKNGVQISLKDWEKLEENDVVIACQSNVKQFVEEHYVYDEITKHESIKTYKIYGRKY